MDTFTNIINNKPGNMTGNKTPVGAITGNGDLAVIMSDEGDDLLIHIAKSDFWKLTEGMDSDGGIKTVGKVRIGNIDLNSCKVVQYMKEGLINCSFGNVCIEMFVSEDNKLYVEIKASINDKFPSMSFEMSDECGSKNYFCNDSAVSWYMRKFDGKNVLKETAVAVCCRRFPSIISGENKIVRFVFSAVTNLETSGYTAKAIELALNGDYAGDKKKTSAFWHKFFSASDISIPDKEIERYYHGSLYLLRCCMGNGKFPPGLYGNFITDDKTPLHGAYHLNHSFEEPFYCVFSSNHPEMAECYIRPLVDFMPKAEQLSKDYLDCKGVYFPSDIGPCGVNFSCTLPSTKTEKFFPERKNNASYAAVIPVMTWYSTYDKKYARDNLFPYLSEVAEFWEGYLVKEDGRYVIKDDATEDVPYFRDNFREGKYKSEIHAVNNVLSLGLVRMVMKCLIDMERELNINTKKIPFQQDILDNLSDYPTYTRCFKRCFRCTENGKKRQKNDSICIQHIYPASQIGLSSDKKLLKTSRNTYFAKDRRLDEKGAVSYLPCGARLGIKPDYLLEGLKLNIEKFALPNMLFNHETGCIEHLSTVPATINEMLLQSHDGIIRIFPSMDINQDISFENLRADGAFLVSASASDGEVKNFKIKSLAGRICRVRIPENAKTVLRTANGQKIKFKKLDGCIEFKTNQGVTYSLI